MARGNDRPALWIVNEGGGEHKLSFAEIAERSNRVANYLRGLGVERGDRMLLMLGNVVPLWEVDAGGDEARRGVIPATTLLDPRRSARPLRARPRPPRHHQRRQHRRNSPTSPAITPASRSAAAAIAPGWHRYEDAYEAPARFAPDGETRATDPLLLYFTSGTTARAEAGAAQPSELPGRPSVDDVLDRPASPATST